MLEFQVVIFLKKNACTHLFVFVANHVYVPDINIVVDTDTEVAVMIAPLKKRVRDLPEPVLNSLMCVQN